MSNTALAESVGSFGDISTAAQEVAADKTSSPALNKIKSSRKQSQFGVLAEELETVDILVFNGPFMGSSGRDFLRNRDDHPSGAAPEPRRPRLGPHQAGEP